MHIIILHPYPCFMLQDDEAMFLFGDDDENYQEQSLPGVAPTRGKCCMMYSATMDSTAVQCQALSLSVLP